MASIQSNTNTRHPVKFEFQIKCFSKYVPNTAWDIITLIICYLSEIQIKLGIRGVFVFLFFFFCPLETNPGQLAGDVSRDEARMGTLLSVQVCTNTGALSPTWPWSTQNAPEM